MASVVCVTIIATVGPQPATADSGPVLEGATAYNSQRKIAVGRGADVAVTYVDRVNTITTVLAKLSHDSGRTWQPLPPLSTAEAFRSSIAFDGAGGLHVAWTESTPSGRQVFYAELGPGGEWIGRERLSDTAGYSGYPSLAVDSADQLHVVWYGLVDSTYQVFYRYRDPRGEWSSTVQASQFVRDANAPAIAIGPDDRVHVAFFTFVEGAYDVKYMVGGPGGWSSVERVNPVNTFGRQPSVVVSRSGVPAIAYTQGMNAQTEVVYTERGDSGWVRGAMVSPGGSGADAPSLAALPDDGMLVAFQTAKGPVMTARRVRTGSWARAEPLAGAPAEWPSLPWAGFPSWSWRAAPPAVWTASGPPYNLGFSTHVGPVRGAGEPRAALAAVVVMLLGLAIFAGRSYRRSGSGAAR